MPRFKNSKGDVIETSNAVEMVRLRASGYTQLDKQRARVSEPAPAATEQSATDSGDKPKNSGRTPRS